MIGDFNGTVNNDVDRLCSDKKRKTHNGKLPDTFFQLLESERLVDVWRKRNQGSRDYMFYSARHKVWLRIDMVWVTKELELHTNKLDILTRNISDHSPVVGRERGAFGGGGQGASGWQERVGGSVQERCGFGGGGGRPGGRERGAFGSTEHTNTTTVVR